MAAQDLVDPVGQTDIPDEAVGSLEGGDAGGAPSRFGGAGGKGREAARPGRLYSPKTVPV
ncbi:MAG: hypothetical protein OXC54_06735 [Rhodospirillaceae bacterium]|nr:hypothetical protein [Rhodospirillaceae bacterium]MCY4310989.1 hypothetical protein [Rhodospirillaceae bacterium]